MFKEDTITAISTSMGYGGIAIIKISGKDSFEVIKKIFKRSANRSFDDMGKSSIAYGHIVDEVGTILDEVLVSKMNAPHTYTTEDVVEINCHGGMTAVKNVLDLVLRSGARIADAGEFTKRAFLNGRIDLSQAEAVSDVIMAKTALASRSALSQLSGELSKEINVIKKAILKLLSHLEVTIQYPEYDIEDVTDEELVMELEVIRNHIARLISTYKKGEILKEGLKVAICGKPNVGKSQLLNALIGQNKAIVTEIAGTTRDIVDEFINLSGVPVKIIDTAGIRESDDLVESIGIKRSISTINESDVVLLVVDGSKALDELDRSIIESAKDKTVIAVVNKSDLGLDDSVVDTLAKFDMVKISALNKINLEELEDKLYNLAISADEVVSDAIVTNARHKNMLLEAFTAIECAINAHRELVPIDFVEIDIRQCLESLGKITGETVSEDLIDEIFANFCLGK